MHMDIGSGIALLGPAAVVAKILGPTADYLGRSLETWTKARIENLRSVFANAEGKLGVSIDSPGQVAPRVLKEILDNASFIADPLAVEYFGGVLASARTAVQRDDRGASFAALVGSLSTYQLRTHYLVYATIVRLYEGSRRTPLRRTGNLAVYLPFDSYCAAMDFSEEELAKVGSLMTHSFYGLVGKNLIHERFISGEPSHLKSAVELDCQVHRFEFPRTGMVLAPSVLGFQLFTMAHGAGDSTPDDLFAPGVTLPSLAGLPGILDARRLSEFQRDVPAGTGIDDGHEHYPGWYLD